MYVAARELDLDVYDVHGLQELFRMHSVHVGRPGIHRLRYEVDRVKSMN